MDNATSATKMSISISYQSETRLLYCWCNGPLRGQDIIDSITVIRKHPAFQPAQREIWDFLRATSYDISAKEIRHIAALALRPPFQRPKDCLRAILSPQNSSYGMGRMFQMLTNSSSAQTRIFFEESEAQAWFDTYELEVTIPYSHKRDDQLGDGHIRMAP